MIKWSTITYDNKTKKLHVELEGVPNWNSAVVPITYLAESYIDSDPDGDYSDWDLYHKLHQFIAKIISRNDVTIKQFKSTQLVYFEPDIGFLSQEVLEDMVNEYVGEQIDGEIALQRIEEAKKDPSQILSSEEFRRNLEIDN